VRPGALMIGRDDSDCGDKFCVSDELRKSNGGSLHHTGKREKSRRDDRQLAGLQSEATVGFVATSRVWCARSDKLQAGSTGATNGFHKITSPSGLSSIAFIGTYAAIVDVF